MLAHRLIHTALGFLVLGVSMGIAMGASRDFRLTHVHVHINLLGWVTLGMVGLLYLAEPALQRGPLPHAHYWLHTLGLIVFMGGFAWSVLGGTFQLVLVAGGSSAVALGILLLAVHVGLHLRRA